MKFQECNLKPELLRAIEEVGYEQMTPIQEQAIPAMLEGGDLIGQAQTGTGKTAAFGIPLIEKIDPEEKGLQAIVLCPTRELAIQTAEEMRKLTKYTQGIRILPIYGGQDISIQIRSLRGGVPIIVGTPGRVMDHMRRHTLKLENVKMVVLDEADEMLDMGFRDDMEEILSAIPGEHQTALFSATMAKLIMEIAGKFQKDSKIIKITPKELTIPLVKQYYYDVPRSYKIDAVTRLLDYYHPTLSLVFCNTKKLVEEVTELLKGRGYFAEGLHGDMSQYQRDKVMNSFRTQTATILVATDVAARGIDVNEVEAVFNYDVPQDPEYYVHRIGRTGRAGKKGRSFTLITGREIYKIRDLERICHTKMKERVLPSVADVTEAKANAVLDGAVELLKGDTNFAGLMTTIESKLEEEECSAMELCAALLRQAMGEEEKEIPRYTREDWKKDNRRGGRDGKGRRKDGDGRGRRRDGEDGRRGHKGGDDRRKGRKNGEDSDWKEKKKDKKSGEKKSGDKKKDKREKKEKIGLRLDGSAYVKKKKHFH
jgi:ATP-dependent RNA helicase DeaD